MAVNAKFIADFSSFTNAVNNAEIQLRDFEGNAGKVGAALNRLTDSFSGRKIIQEATMMSRVLGDAGSIARLTGNELQAAGTKAAEAIDKMKRLGLDVPPGLQRIADAAKGAGESTSLLTTGVVALAGAFTLAKVASFVSDLIAAAGHLQDMSERTDIGVEALQRFKIIAEQSGSSLDAVSSAVFQMGKRLAGGSDSVVGGVKALGLSFETIRTMRPEDAFQAIGTALAALPDPMQRSKIGADLFGKSVDELIPVFKHLSDGMSGVITLSASQVEAVDWLGDAYVRFKANLVPVTVAMVDNTFQISRSLAFWQALLGIVGELPRVTGKATDGLTAWNKAIADRAAQPLTITLGEETAFIAESNEKVKEAAAAAAKFNAAMEELNATGAGWQGTLATIDGEVVDAVKYYLQAGVAQGTLATAYGLTAAQVKSVASELTAETEATKASAATATKAAEAAKHWADILGELDAVGNGWKGTLATIDGEVVGAIKYYLAAGVAQNTLAEAYGLTAAQVKAVASAMTDEQATAKKEAASLDDLTGKVRTLAGAWITAKEARDNFDAGGSTELRDLTKQQFTEAGGLNRIAMLEDYTKQSYGSTWESYLARQRDLVLLAELQKYVASLPHMATGGPVLRDGPIYAHAGEYVMPQGGGNGGGPTVINLVVDGRVLASVVNSYNVRAIMAGGKIGSS